MLLYVKVPDRRRDVEHNELEKMKYCCVGSAGRASQTSDQEIDMMGYPYPGHIGLK